MASETHDDKKPRLLPTPHGDFYQITACLSAAGSTDEHTYIAPDLFAAETPLGTYQGMTDQVVMSCTPGAFRTVLVPCGSSKAEWLAW